jgi:hypothetical protein
MASWRCKRAASQRIRSVRACSSPQKCPDSDGYRDQKIRLGSPTRNAARSRCFPFLLQLRARDGSVAERSAIRRVDLLLYRYNAHQPMVWTAPPPEMDSERAWRELARRHLQIFGPATANAAFEALARGLAPVRTPAGDAWILAEDGGHVSCNGQRRCVLFGLESRSRDSWPGALPVGGEISGLWR